MTTPESRNRELTAQENDLAALLMRNGWGKVEAEAEARRATEDAIDEAGYDGP